MADRRQFLRTVAGATALSVTTGITTLGRARTLKLSASVPDANAIDRLDR